MWLVEYPFKFSRGLNEKGPPPLKEAAPVKNAGNCVFDRYELFSEELT
jgi:hypothetical protein